MLLRSIKSVCLCGGLALIAQGCLTCFQHPFPTPATYPGQECMQTGTNVRQYGWQNFFTDPTLKCLITLALNNNRELQGAQQQVNPYNVASIEKYNAAFIRLIGEVANTYVTACELNELIGKTGQTLSTRSDGYCIMKVRFEEGAAAEFDFLQAEALLEQAKAELAALELRRALNWNAMMQLVGIPICPVDQLLSHILFCLTAEICPGVPSELICNRPDVRAAKLSPSQTEYERTIQAAFREVADALAQRDWLAEQAIHQKEVLDRQTERANIAWIRFQESTSPFLEVLAAEQERFSAEQALIQTQARLLAGRINLYMSLGGGYCR